MPTQINYCGGHETNQEDCPTHYLVFIPLIWVIDHLDVVAAIVMAIATAYIATFTIVLSNIGKQQANDAQIVQRAFISVEPGGAFSGQFERGLMSDLAISSLIMRAVCRARCPLVH